MSTRAYTRRTWIWAAIGVVALACIGIFAVVGFRLGNDATAVPTPTSSIAAQAHQVATALGALAAHPESLVATAAQSTVAGRASQAVPPGSKVKPEERSWAPDGAGGGTMYVSVAPPGQPPVGYFAVMIEEQGHWKVLATFAATGKP